MRHDGRLGTVHLEEVVVEEVDDLPAPGSARRRSDDGSDDGSDDETYGVVARDATTGRRLWGDEHAQTMSALIGGLLVTQAGDEVSARDVRSGEVRWSTEVESAAVVGTDGDVVLVHSDQDVVALDLVGGEQRWRAPLPAEIASSTSMVVPFSGGYVAGGGWGGRLVLPTTDDVPAIVGRP
ncbi:outer membrane protein assembly factor BamB family protein [Cellulomonas composti]|uniref:Pyrrolo-quinoline quinone repeat domain-containing protein n=1 Tax=Cellulomonas composti TaxID=266130 RepID=A0A511JD33_9CELL|nr:PQQ-binding-like beta-propeller repeat protein [Cellulomonas composti]GEL95885.1 hypothetical protein CCO02nite_25430 [Cellulomonas composti]